MADEAFLARGDIPNAHRVTTRAAARAFSNTSPRRRTLALRRRSILLLAQELEGHGVTISRWLLQASATGRTPHGKASELLAGCNASLHPPVAEVMHAAAARGGVLRRESNLLIAQCVLHHDMWRRLARQKNASVHESTKWGWQPLHFAAAVGATPTVRALLELGARPATFNGAGLAPLHLAMAHGSADAAAMIAAHAPKKASIRTSNTFGQRLSPAEVAVRSSSGRIDRCCRMLNALDAARRAPSESSTLRTASAEDRRELLSSSTSSSPSSSASPSSSSCESRCAAGAPRMIFSMNRESEGAPADENDYIYEASEEEEEERVDMRATVSASVDVRARVRASSSSADSKDGRTRRRSGDCDVVFGLQPSELLFEHVIGSRPVIIPSAAALPRAMREGWRREAMARRYGDVSLPLERYPYAEGSSALYGDVSNRSTIFELSRSREVAGVAEGRRWSKLSQSSEMTGVAKGGSTQMPGHTRRKKRRKRKEEKGEEEEEMEEEEEEEAAAVQEAVELLRPPPPRSVFAALQGWAQGSDTDLVEANELSLTFDAANEPGFSMKRLLVDWHRPPAVRHTQLRPQSVQFYLGGEGAGAQPHWHQTAFNWVRASHLRGSRTSDFHTTRPTPPQRTLVDPPSHLRGSAD